MGPGFVFEPPSDEELEDMQAEGDDQHIEEEGGEEEDDDGDGVSKTSRRHSQSPWDFASHSESVADEHARRSTTSIDFKISKALQSRSVPVNSAAAAAAAEDDNSGSESEVDRQVSSFP